MHLRHTTPTDEVKMKPAAHVALWSCLPIDLVDKLLVYLF
jgi:hypothetical protein